MFTAIDAIREVPASISQERPYDFMMPVIGTIVGAGFGGIKFLDPVGKSSNFRVEMADGIRSAFGRNIYANNFEPDSIYYVFCYLNLIKNGV